MTRARLDANSAALVAGDVVCNVADAHGNAVVTKATPTALGIAGRAWGILKEDTLAPGAKGRFFGPGDRAPASYTGLTTSGFVRVSAAARCEVVGSYETGDTPLGKGDSLARLLLEPEATLGADAGISSIEDSDTVEVEVAAGVATLSLTEPFAGIVVSLAGANRAAAINAAIVTANATYVSTGRQQLVRLLAGSATLETAIVLLSGVRLVGSGLGATVLLNGLGAGVATDPTNAMIIGQGALNLTKLDSVPTTTACGASTPYYPPGSEAVSVSNTGFGTLADADWIFYSGHNNAAYPEYTNSPGNTLVWGDILQVASIVDNGGDKTLRLEHDVLSYHTVDNGGSGTPITVKGCDPIINASVSDLTLDGANIAVGVLIDYGVDIAVERVSFTRFALEGLYTRYCRHVLVDGCYCAGGINGMARLDTTHDYIIRNTRCSDRGDRYCSVGRSFGWVSLINNCSQGQIYDNEITHFGLALNLTGFRALSLSNNHIRDLDSEEYQTRDAAAADNFTLGLLGLGVNLGCVSLDVAEFNQGFSDTNTTIDDARHAQLTGVPANTDDCSYWWHDTTDGVITNLAIRNKGKSPYHNIDGVVRYMSGLRGHDASGQFSNVHIRGCDYSLRISAGGWKMNNVEIVPYASQGPVPTVGIFFEAALGIIGIIELQNITTTSIYYGSGFGDSDYSLATVRNLRIGDYWFEGPLFFAHNQTGAVVPGAGVVALRNDGTTYVRELVLPDHANAGPLVRAAAGPGGFGAPINGHALFELLPSTRGHIVAKTADEVKVGQVLKHEGGASTVVTPLGAGATVGIALTPKAAAVAGAVLAGFAS